jgi:hypothetical protein
LFAGVILTSFQRKFKIGAKKSSPEFGNQFLNSVTFAPEAMPAEVTVEPGLAACPMGAFMGKALERFVWQESRVLKKPKGHRDGTPHGEQFW